MTIRVLLADDHAVVRDGLRALLELRGDIEVVGEACDGRLAVAEAIRLRPDIVLMDICMPNRNGIESTQLLRADSPSTKVIILSMHSTFEHIFRALHAGASGYVLKQSAGTEVVLAARSVHAGKRYLSPRVAEALLGDYVREGKASSPLEALSHREREILQLIAEGKTSAEVGYMLSLSRKTVDTYRSRLMQKIGVGHVPGVVKFAIQHGLIDLQ